MREERGRLREIDEIHGPTRGVFQIFGQLIQRGGRWFDGEEGCDVHVACRPGTAEGDGAEDVGQPDVCAVVEHAADRVDLGHAGSIRGSSDDWELWLHGSVRERRGSPVRVMGNAPPTPPSQERQGRITGAVLSTLPDWDTESEKPLDPLLGKVDTQETHPEAVRQVSAKAVSRTLALRHRA